jgi:hypothetical protein
MKFGEKDSWLLKYSTGTVLIPLLENGLLFLLKINHTRTLS